LGLANAVAAGVMLGASFGLIHEGFRDGSPYRTLGGMVGGVLFITVAQIYVDRYQDIKFAGLSGLNARKALLLVLVMTVHSFTEGVGVGVSFGKGEAFGVFITTAIAIHNIPEGLAISLAMVPRGSTVFSAGLWSVFSSIPQPIMAVPAFILVTIFAPWLPLGLGFAGGAMIWLVFYELLPDALEHTSPRSVAVTATGSMIMMQAFQVFLSV